jgi:hypothetical protein
MRPAVLLVGLFNFNTVNLVTLLKVFDPFQVLLGRVLREGWQDRMDCVLLVVQPVVGSRGVKDNSCGVSHLEVVFIDSFKPEKDHLLQALVGKVQDFGVVEGLGGDEVLGVDKEELVEEEILDGNVTKVLVDVFGSVQFSQQLKQVAAVWDGLLFVGGVEVIDLLLDVLPGLGCETVL